MAVDVSHIEWGDETILAFSPSTVQFLWEADPPVLSNDVCEKRLKDFLKLLNYYSCQKCVVPFNIWGVGLSLSERLLNDSLSTDPHRLDTWRVHVNYIEDFLVKCYDMVQNPHHGCLSSAQVTRLLTLLQCSSCRMLQFVEKFVFNFQPNNQTLDPQNPPHYVDCIQRLARVIHLVCQLWILYLPRTFSLWSARRILKAVTEEILDLVVLPLLGLYDYLDVLYPDFFLHLKDSLTFLQRTLMAVQVNTLRVLCSYTLKWASLNTTEEGLVRCVEEFKKTPNFLNDLVLSHKTYQTSKYAYVFHALKTLQPDESYATTDSLRPCLLKTLGTLSVIPHLLSACYIQCQDKSPGLACEKFLILVLLVLKKIYHLIDPRLDSCVSRSTERRVLGRGCFRAINYILHSLHRFHIHTFLDSLSEIFSDMLHTVFMLVYQTLREEKNAAETTIRMDCWDIFQEILRLNLSYFDSKMDLFFKCLSHPTPCVNQEEKKRSESLALVVTHFYQASDFVSIFQGLEHFFLETRKGRGVLNCLTSQEVLKAFRSVYKQSTPVQIVHYTTLFIDLAEKLSSKVVSRQSRKRLPFYQICTLLGYSLRDLQLSNESLIVSFFKNTEQINHLIERLQHTHSWMFSIEDNFGFKFHGALNSGRKKRLEHDGFWRKCFQNPETLAYVFLIHAQLSLHEQLDSWIKPPQLQEYYNVNDSSLFSNSWVAETLRRSLLKNSTIHVAFFCRFLKGLEKTYRKRKCKTFCHEFFHDSDGLWSIFLDSLIRLHTLSAVYPMFCDPPAQYWKYQSLVLVNVLLKIFKSYRAMESWVPRLLPHLLRGQQDLQSPMISCSDTEHLLTPSFLLRVSKSVNHSVKKIFRRFLGFWRIKLKQHNIQSVSHLVQHITIWSSQLNLWFQQILIHFDFVSRPHFMKNFILFCTHSVKSLGQRLRKKMKTTQTLPISLWQTFTLDLCFLFIFFKSFPFLIKPPLDVVSFLGRFLKKSLKFCIHHLSVSPPKNPLQVTEAFLETFYFIIFCILSFMVDSFLLQEITLGKNFFHRLKSLLGKVKRFFLLSWANQQDPHLVSLASGYHSLALFFRLCRHQESPLPESLPERLCEFYQTRLVKWCLPFLALSTASPRNILVNSPPKKKNGSFTSFSVQVKDTSRPSQAKKMASHIMALCCSILLLSSLPKVTFHIQGKSKAILQRVLLKSQRNPMEAWTLESVREALSLGLLISAFERYSCDSFPHQDKRENNGGFQSNPYSHLLHVLCQATRSVEDFFKKNLSETPMAIPLFWNSSEEYLLSLVQLFSKWITSQKEMPPTELHLHSEFHHLVSVLCQHVTHYVSKNFNYLEALPQAVTLFDEYPNPFLELVRPSMDRSFLKMVKIWTKFTNSLCFVKNLLCLIRLIYFNFSHTDIILLRDPSAVHLDSKLIGFLVCVALISYNRSLLIRSLGFLRLKKTQGISTSAVTHHPSSKLFTYFRYMIHAIMLHLRYELRQMMLDRLEFKGEMSLDNSQIQRLLEKVWIWMIHFSLLVKITVNLHETVKLVILQEKTLDLWKYSFLLELLNLASMGAFQFTQVCSLMNEAQSNLYPFQSSNMYSRGKTIVLQHYVILVDFFIHNICACLSSSILLRKDIGCSTSSVSRFLYRYLNKRSAQLRFTFNQLLTCLEELPLCENALELARHLTRLWTALYTSNDLISRIMKREACHILHTLLHLHIITNVSLHTQRSFHFKTYLYNVFSFSNKNSPIDEVFHSVTPDIGYEEQEWRNVQQCLRDSGFYPLLNHLSDDLKQYLYTRLRKNAQENFSSLYSTFQRSLRSTTTC